jgi:hypothetical protein
VIHDLTLINNLLSHASCTLDTEVFRATRRGLDPTAPSVRGGRWMLENEHPALYTSRERDGALAEIAFHWSILVPPPSKPVLIHRIALRVSKALRLERHHLSALGIRLDGAAPLNDPKTQAIGAAAAHLEFEALIVPSIRWECENVIVLTNHLAADATVVLATEEVDWRAWHATNKHRIPHV